MPQVELHINGRPYKIACGEGEEARTTALAAEVDRRVSDLKKQIGNVGDARLLVLASILMADELADARARGRTANPAPEPEQPRLPSAPAPGEDDRSAALEEAAAAIERLAERIERIAESFEAA